MIDQQRRQPSLDGRSRVLCNALDALRCARAAVLRLIIFLAELGVAALLRALFDLIQQLDVSVVALGHLFHQLIEVVEYILIATGLQRFDKVLLEILEHVRKDGRIQ